MLDPGLCARPEPEIEEILQTLGVALLCVNPSPEDRPTMKGISANAQRDQAGEGGIYES